jgi:hypothetical protein
MCITPSDSPWSQCLNHKKLRSSTQNDKIMKMIRKASTISTLTINNSTEEANSANLLKSNLKTRIQISLTFYLKNQTFNQEECLTIKSKVKHTSMPWPSLVSKASPKRSTWKTQVAKDVNGYWLKVVIIFNKKRIRDKVKAFR